jgi:predicted dehydrogenase
MVKKYKLCLIGCGRMGATIDDEVKDRPDSHLYLPYSHAAAIRALEEAEFVGLSDVVADKVEAIRRRYSVLRGYTDYREMIEKERPDVVCIATRPVTHRELVVHAAEQGVKGIYCEKPLCCSMEEADAMVEACDRRGVRFNYGTQRRYMDPYLKVRELTRAGEIGNVSAVVASCGVGAALWSHTHTADMLLFLADDAEVDYVQGVANVDAADFADNRVDGDPGIPMGYVRFKSGVHAYLTAGTGYEFEVSGSKGKLRTLNNGSGARHWRANRWGLLEEAPFPEWQRASGTVAGIRDVIQAIEAGRETQGNIRLARRSQEIIMGFVESERLSGARVKFPMENRGLYIGKKDW